MGCKKLLERMCDNLIGKRSKGKSKRWDALMYCDCVVREIAMVGSHAVYIQSANTDNLSWHRKLPHRKYSGEALSH